MDGRGKVLGEAVGEGFRNWRDEEIGEGGGLVHWKQGSGRTGGVRSRKGQWKRRVVEQGLKGRGDRNAKQYRLQRQGEP